MNFRFPTLSQKQLGLLFGVSSHKIGEWLTEVGLRNDQTKRPTSEAHHDGFCEQAPSGQFGYHWVWRSQPTVERLIAAGHPLVMELPESIVVPPTLNGPFKLSTKNSKVILSADGSMAAIAASAGNAQMILKLLQVGHRIGFDRVITPSAAS
jgi:hypothetical protein